VTDGSAAGFSGGSAVGDGLFVVNAFLWAAFTWASAPVVGRLGLVKATAYAALFGGGLLSLGSLPAAMEQDWSQVSPALAWNFLFLTVIAGAGAQLAYYAGLRRLGVARAMAYLYLVPVFGIVIALGLLGESFSLLQAAGPLRCWRASC
jgi:drug/metabolite transporter (DMT)-like permease